VDLIHGRWRLRCAQKQQKERKRQEDERAEKY
jgi:hypothetical protein